MTKKNRLEIASEILARVKEEMRKPRLAESVREGLRLHPEPLTGKPGARAARA